MAALVGQDFAGGGPGFAAGVGAAKGIAQPAGYHLDGVVARCRVADLLAEHVFGKVPADGDDVGGPGNAGAAKQEGAASVRENRGAWLAWTSIVRQVRSWRALP